MFLVSLRSLCAAHSVHCASHTVHCAAHSVHCAAHTVHCAAQNAHCAAHTAHCAAHTVHCAAHTVHCAAHTLHGLRRYLFFPSPPSTIFSSLCIPKSPEIVPGGSCLGPFGVVCLAIEGHQNLTHSDSELLIPRTFLPRAGSSYTSLI